MRRVRDMIGKVKAPSSGKILRAATIGILLTTMLLAAGCSRAPSLNILGSFFPAWLLCGLIGTLLTAIARFLFVRMNFEQELSPLILVYPCLAALFTFTLWLLFFS